MGFATPLLILTLTVLVIGVALFAALTWVLQRDTKRLEERAEELEAAAEHDTQPPH